MEFETRYFEFGTWTVTYLPFQTHLKTVKFEVIFRYNQVTMEEEDDVLFSEVQVMRDGDDVWHGGLVDEFHPERGTLFPPSIKYFIIMCF